MQIRQATDMDLEQMADLLAILFDLEADFEPNRFKQVAGLAQMMVEPGAQVLVAIEDEKVVGMISVQRMISTAEGGPVGMLEDLVVHPDFHNQGIGRALLEAMKKRAEICGLTRLQLVADRENLDAWEFLKSVGWTQTQLRIARRHI